MPQLTADQAAHIQNLDRKIGAIARTTERITAAWNEDGLIYPGHVDTLHRLVGELYALTGRTPPGA